MSLTLAVNEVFEGNEVEIYWNEHNEPVMTIEQLSKSLGYSDRSGVDKIVQRNSYLDDNEFSVADKLSSTDGKKYETRIFNEDGIYEVTMLSSKPKAKEFRSFVRKTLKALRKGEMQAVQPRSDYDKLQVEKMKAEARLMNARTRQAKLVLDMQKNKTLSPVAVELLQVNALETLTDNQTDYRPEVEKTYTATDIAKELNISANKVGRIANANGLKTDEYGIEVLDKSRHSHKQVPSFRYNETGKQKIKELI